MALPRSAAPAVELFMLSAAHWRRTPSAPGSPSMAVGLDYPAVEAIARMAGIAMSPDVFHDLRAIESGALRKITGSPEP